MASTQTRTLSSALVLVMLLVLALAPGIAHAATKPFTVNVSPGSVPAGSRATFTAHFANPAGAQQQLGSARLTAPSGLQLVPGSAVLGGAGTVTSSGSVITLSNLALQPGSSIDLTVAADAPCAAASLTWSVQAKQANEFNGPPGNDLTLVAPSSLSTSVTGQCALRFATQPANARTGATITGTAYAAGPPVSVEVVDGAGQRVTSSAATVTMDLGAGSGPGVLGGDRKVDAVMGLAPFSDLTLSKPGLYTLVASSPGLASATSDVFRIDDAAAFCPEDITCSSTTSTSRSKLEVTAFLSQNSTDAGFLTLSFNAALALDCAGYDEITPDTALLDFTSLNRTKTATLTIDKRQMALVPNNGAAFLQLCFGSPVPFRTRDGVLASAQGTYDWNGDGTPEPVYTGLLPDCAGGTGPCVTSRNKVGAGDGQIIANIPAGLADPGMRG